MILFLEVGEYKPSYDGLVNFNPSIDEMLKCVVDNRDRPTIPPEWRQTQVLCDVTVVLSYFQIQQIYTLFGEILGFNLAIAQISLFGEDLIKFSLNKCKSEIRNFSRNKKEFIQIKQRKHVFAETFLQFVLTLSVVETKLKKILL